ncbi:MAG: GNAT family N-acetyltransferase [Candidatus Melainabacteria bacterium]|nr:MAG: GNAT family N-acetyltransferase [Candidatus Melainabacteria bacterium]
MNLLDQPDQLRVRTLTERDLEEFRALRLRGLKEDPHAFGMSFEEASHTPLEDWNKLLSNEHGSFILGAFAPQLIGLVAFSRSPRIKTRHKGHIWGMYVIPEARGRGIGKTLMQNALAKLQAIDGLAVVTLCVVTLNTAARSLYLNLGFVPYGLEKRALRVNGEYLDEELLSINLAH